MVSGQGALFDGHDPALYRHPALWPTLDEADVALDEQARWIWPASFPITADTYDPDEGREYWGDQEAATTRDAYRNWTQDSSPGQGLADYTAEVQGEWW